MPTTEPESIAEKIGAAMRALRKRSGFSQSDVARRMGLKDSGYIGLGRNERAVQVPRADKLVAFLHAVGADLADLQHFLESHDPENQSQVSDRGVELTCELSQIDRRKPS